jgi:hypothetical protein
VGRIDDNDDDPDLFCKTLIMFPSVQIMDKPSPRLFGGRGSRCTDKHPIFEGFFARRIIA